MQELRPKIKIKHLIAEQTKLSKHGIEKQLKIFRELGIIARRRIDKNGLWFINKE